MPVGARNGALIGYWTKFLGIFEGLRGMGMMRRYPPIF